MKPTSDGGYIFYRLDQKYNTNRSNLYKFNSVGQLLWHQQIASDSLEFGEDVSNLIVDSTGILLNGNCYYPDPGQTIGVERFYLVKTDTSGQKLWGTVYGDSSYYYGENYTSLVGLHDDYYAFGDHFDTASSHFFPPLIKVLKNGIPSYNHDIFNNSSGGISTAAWLNDTIIILGGILLLNSNTSQVIMLKADTLGNFSSVVPFLQISNYLMNTYKTFDKKFVSTGFMWQTNKNVIYLIKVNSDLQYDTLYTHPFTYDSLCSHPIVSDTIDPDCGLIVNVEEPFSKPETHQLKVFPNPTTTQISIVFPQYLMVENNSGVIKTTTVYHQWKSTFLEVYNLNGERLFQKEIPKDQTRLELDVSSWPKGMYLLRLIYNKQTVAGEKVIIK
ncbi:MAG: T9SS type A sorting domain-containing protein [Bacteroidetes bacterium]|nr:T9SS type A sorting domain-containing protein [Bacteroidota bacterium]